MLSAGDLVSKFKETATLVENWLDALPGVNKLENLGHFFLHAIKPDLFPEREKDITNPETRQNLLSWRRCLTYDDLTKEIEELKNWEIFGKDDIEKNLNL